MECDSPERDVSAQEESAEIGVNDVCSLDELGLDEYEDVLVTTEDGDFTDAAESKASRLDVVNWTIKTHETFKLSPNTMFIACAILDRILRMIPGLDRAKYSLLGCAALFIAAKFEEEENPPGAADFLYASDGSFSRSDLITCEGQIWNMLDFIIPHASPIKNLEQLAAEGVDRLNPSQLPLAMFLLELSLYTVADVTAEERARRAIESAKAGASQVQKLIEANNSPRHDALYHKHRVMLRSHLGEPDALLC
eukprot:GEMP01034949.1.p1 GENE.GEMP01034949.1~~GEMP01034949.1.p1  ORF type:complete len:252 (-),score=61.85 GEMP01034949.1:1217-1972(-)